MVQKQTCHHTFVYTFAKYWPILIILKFYISQGSTFWCGEILNDSFIANCPESAIERLLKVDQYLAKVWQIQMGQWGGCIFSTSHRFYVTWLKVRVGSGNFRISLVIGWGIVSVVTVIETGTETAVLYLCIDGSVLKWSSSGVLNVNSSCKSSRPLVSPAHVIVGIKGVIAGGGGPAPRVGD